MTVVGFARREVNSTSETKILKKLVEKLGKGSAQKIDGKSFYFNRADLRKK
jgi:Mor family transcriptional regulator